MDHFYQALQRQHLENDSALLRNSTTKDTSFSIATPMAAAVLSMNELLVIILKHFPIKILFHLQSVNKRFKTVIEGTHSLQETLLLHAEALPRSQTDILNLPQHLGALALRDWHTKPRKTAVINPLLQGKFPAWFEQYHHTYGQDNAPSPRHDINALINIDEAFTRPGAS